MLPNGPLSILLSILKGAGRRINPATAPRLITPLWGTTTWSDCLSVLGYLALPGRLVRGDAIAAYEEAFARRIGVRFAFSFSAGRVGLYGALWGLDIGVGDEVLLQVPTHMVIPSAVRYTGAKPVFVDCSADTCNMDLGCAEQLVTSRTKAIILQHTFGIPVDMDAALALARRHNLAVIEDCVHALGSTYGGRPVGSFGEAAFFSTEETKTISSMMGGIAVTDSPQLAAKLRAFQAECEWPSASLAGRYAVKAVLYHILGHPRVAPYAHPLYSRLRRTSPLNLAPAPTTEEEQHGLRPSHYERRLSNVQAALALRQLRRLDPNIAHRKGLAETYRAGLAEMGAMTPDQPSKAEAAFVRYPVWVEDPAAAIRHMAGNAVLGEWFTSVLEESVTPEYGGYEPGSCPVAEEAVRHLVNLPTHPRTTPLDAQRILAALRDVPLWKGRAGQP